MPICSNPSCRARLAPGQMVCPRCGCGKALYVKPHLHKRGGVWLARPSGHFLTRLTTEPKRQHGLRDCLRLAELWNEPNA